MSAIDWLSDSVTTPAPQEQSAPEDDISTNALPQSISVMQLGRPLPDAVGLLPVNVTGLPRNLWGSSSSGILAQHLQEMSTDMLPAMQALLYTLMLAELDPPADAGPASVLFLARIDTLLSLGAIEPADALLRRAGPTHPEIFRRKFDTSLLLGSENEACETLRATPELSPTYPARIFCLARGGNWDAAELTLGTGRALGLILSAENQLIAKFLDPTLFEDDAPLPIPDRPNPLVFRMMGAIGESIPSATLPRAFAITDLSPTSGWKAQIESAERLARTGAINPNRLLAYYTNRQPAASGGVWDRVEAIQNLEVAIASGNAATLDTALPLAWSMMQSIDLETALAQLFAQGLADVTLTGATASLAFRINLLSDRYEQAANTYTAKERLDTFLQSIAQGNVSVDHATTPLEIAIADGFGATGVPPRLQSLVNEHRLGEAILQAMQLFTEGATGNLEATRDSLAFFRAVGLEDAARRGALQLLLLDRRG